MVVLDIGETEWPSRVLRVVHALISGEMWWVYGVVGGCRHPIIDGAMGLDSIEV